MPGDDNESVSTKWKRTIAGTTDTRDVALTMLDECARYNAAVIRDMGDLLYYRRVKREDVVAMVAALDAAIAVQIFLTDTIESMSDEPRKR